MLAWGRVELGWQMAQNTTVGAAADGWRSKIDKENADGFTQELAETVNFLLTLIYL